MRTTTLFTLFFIAVSGVFASPVDQAEVGNILEARAGSPTGTCSTGGPQDRGASCSALKCASDSKAGDGNGVCNSN